MTTSPNDQLALVSDELAIRKQTDTFSDAANRVDAQLFASLWTTDGEWIIGPPINQQFTGRDNMVDAITKMLGQWKFFVQLPTAQVVVLQGDVAYSRVYVNEVASSKEGQGNYNLSMYDDELVRTEGQWLFRKRTYHTIYQGSPSYTGQFLGVPQLSDVVRQLTQPLPPSS